MVQKLANFYGVPKEDFMDDYNRFLSDRQSNRIQKYREATGLKKSLRKREMNSYQMFAGMGEQQKDDQPRILGKRFQGKSLKATFTKWWNGQNAKNRVSTRTQLETPDFEYMDGYLNFCEVYSLLTGFFSISACCLLFAVTITASRRSSF